MKMVATVAQVVEVDGVPALRYRIEPGRPNHTTAVIAPALIAMVSGIPPGTDVELELHECDPGEPTGMKVVGFMLAEPATE